MEWSDGWPWVDQDCSCLRWTVMWELRSWTCNGGEALFRCMHNNGGWRTIATVDEYQKHIENGESSVFAREGSNNTGSKVKRTACCITLASQGGVLPCVTISTVQLPSPLLTNLLPFTISCYSTPPSLSLPLFLPQGEQPHCGFPEKNYAECAERLARKVCEYGPRLIPHTFGDCSWACDVAHTQCFLLLACW